MTDLKQHFVVDEKGNRIGVVPDIKEYGKLLAEHEELAFIRAYDTAKASGDQAVPFEQAVSGIERNHK